MTTTANSTLKDIFVSWNQAFKDLENQKEIITPVSFSGQDPLALSWAAYNNWMDVQGLRFTDLNAITPTDVDYDLAEKTRTYYRDRLAIKALKGIELTKFQNDLYAMLNSSEFMSNQLGMLYKLPYFYIEDTSRDRIYAKTHSLSKKHPQYLERTGTIVPIEKFVVSRKPSEFTEYWFEDQNQHGVMIKVQNNNPLKSVINGMYNHHCPVKVKGHWRITHNNHNIDYKHWIIANMEFVF